MAIQDEDKQMSIEPFAFEQDDELQAEHTRISQWIEEETKHSLGKGYYSEVDMKDSDFGCELLSYEGEKARRHALAFLAQARHWTNTMHKIGSQSRVEGILPHEHPEWFEACSRRGYSLSGLRTLLRRRIPLQRQDLLALVEVLTNAVPAHGFPRNQVARIVGEYRRNEPLSAELCHRLSQLAQAMQSAGGAPMKREAGLLFQMIAEDLPDDHTSPATVTYASPATEPAPAGSPGVMAELKKYLGFPVASPEVAAYEFGPDEFPLRTDSPLQSEHVLLTLLFEDVVGENFRYNMTLHNISTGRDLLALDPMGRGRAILAAAERSLHVDLAGPGGWDSPRSQCHTAADISLQTLLHQEHEFTREGTIDFFLYLSALAYVPWLGDLRYITNFVESLAKEAATTPFTPGERHVLHRLRSRLVQSPPLGKPSALVGRLTCLINDGMQFYLVPGEIWADTANEDLATMPDPHREAWRNLLAHALTATSPRPSAKWLKTATPLLEAVGRERFAATLARWLSDVPSGRSIHLLYHQMEESGGRDGTIHDENANILRGLLWMTPLIQNAELVRAIGTLAISCYRKIPRIGPRAVKVGNAAIYALSQMTGPDAVGQLAVLRVKVKFGTAQKELDKALTVAAQRAGISREEIEELGIPAYGFETGGIRTEKLGNARAELRVVGSQVETTWFNDKDKVVKSPSAEAKRTHAEDIKELKAAAIDAERMLAAQRERIDLLHLSRKSWSLAAWRERYLDHPLVGTIARRLIWSFTHKGHTEDGVPLDDQIVGLDSHPLKRLVDGTTVTMWHPIGHDHETILGWQEWLEKQEIRQPFKQAHREVYLLTDAERTTGVYSNRFAAHILRQHQFNALCSLRGWKNKLRLMVDDEFPPATLHLPQWQLRAEFWINGIGDDFGADTNETGVYYRVSTDQVRFYAEDAAQRTAHGYGGGYGIRTGGDNPVPLTEVPPLVLSEVLRDVDLFVGVASVANDPNWADGGPGGRYRNYWTEYAFGDLNETAKTRRAVLERLIPRLSIADRCSFSDRFLVVRGELRTYNIHLGSGNIQMEPDNQYLCIVKAPERGDGGRVFLPFEGDGTLAVILSKAFLLAEDRKITDPTILSQIRR